jgi:ubiquinone biosynthesis accessory factor UbiJ
MLTEALNRLLTHDPPAREKLAAYAGKTVRFDLTPIVLNTQINERGFFVEIRPEPSAQFDLKIALPLTSTPLAVLGKERVLQEARIEGNIALGNAINALLENLPLAIEQETENVLGPVLAHSLSQAGQRASKLFSAIHESVTRNLAHTLKQPDGPVPEAKNVRDWAYEINATAQRTEALAQRIARLERKQYMATDE